MLRFLFKGKEEDKSPERKFWIYASGEFFLVFLGILVALQVENWNQNRLDRKLERVLLAEMLENLGEDLEDIDLNILIKEQCIQSNQIVMQYLEGDLPWHDSLQTHFGNLIQGTVFVNNISTFESLESIGVDIISNDSLRQLITFVYSARYRYIASKENECQMASFQFLYPTLHQYLEYLPGRLARPLNRETIRQSPVVRSDLQNYRFLVGLSITAYVSTRGSVIELMGMIEAELER
ncbi:MAG: DUF6090 family protein [Bacteroidales bacterium]